MDGHKMAYLSSCPPSKKKNVLEKHHSRLPKGNFTGNVKNNFGWLHVDEGKQNLFCCVVKQTGRVLPQRMDALTVSIPLW